MKLNEITTALVIAPHTDDGEFGCGGTIARLINEGITIHYVAFSACQKSVLPQYSPDILITELNCNKSFGYKKRKLTLT